MKLKTLSPEYLDSLLTSYISGFAQWFIDKQKAAGRDGIGLIGPERGVLKAYLVYLLELEEAEQTP